MNCLQQVNLERNHNDHGKTNSISGTNMKRLNCTFNVIHNISEQKTQSLPPSTVRRAARPRPENVEKSPFISIHFAQVYQNQEDIGL